MNTQRDTRTLRKTIAALSVTMAVLTAACAQPEVPTDNFYRVRAAQPEATLDSPPIKGTVEVELSADGLVDGRNIIYSEYGTPNQLKEYHYHFWTEPPKAMLRDQLVTYLRAAGAASKVVTPEMRATPDYVINGKIKRLEKVAGSNPGAVVELELALMKADNGKLVMLGSYGSVESSAENNSVPAAIAAVNESLSKIFARFVEDLKKM